ncbi:hypothetical protein BDF14DRAFT_1766826 [Spinellus fusiger]|nr:hypothetical protein BDF14DRAFT_1766826 [Spinellus fusiger]
MTFEDLEMTLPETHEEKLDKKDKTAKKDKKDKTAKKDKKDKKKKNILGKRPVSDVPATVQESPVAKKRHHAAHDPPTKNKTTVASVFVLTPEPTPEPTPTPTPEPTPILDTKQRPKAKTSSSSSSSYNIKKPATQLIVKRNNTKASTDPADILERVKENRKRKRLAKLAKKNINGTTVKVPTLVLKLQELKTKMPIKSIRQFITYCLTEAATPCWGSILNKSRVQHVLLVFAQGLDVTYFGVEQQRQNVPHALALSEISDNAIGKASMPFFARQFSHMLVSKLSGEKGKIASPISELLQCDVSMSEKHKLVQSKWDRSLEHKHNMKEYYVMTLDQLRAAEYPIPSFLDATATLPDGWKETRPAKTPTKEKKLIAVDCEMVLTASGSALARVTLIDEDGTVLLDEVVKPDEPVMDYLTHYSGITPEILANAHCSFTRAQKHIRKIVDHNTLLIGHSLDNDLKAMKLAHPYCADTSLLFDHFRGPPYRPGLKMLTRRFLQRDIQEQNENTVGHDSAEDARATLDLFKLKLERGPEFGVYSKKTELIFDRLRKFDPPKTGAILESAQVNNRLLGATVGSGYVRCENDEALVGEIVEKIKTTHFVLSQFRSLQQGQDVQDEEAVPSVIPDAMSASHEIAAKLTRFDGLFKEMYEKLPCSTAIVVMGGSGEVSRYKELMAKSRRYHELYLAKGIPKTDIPEEHVWTPKDQKTLLGECAKAKLCSTFFTIKQ